MANDAGATPSEGYSVSALETKLKRAACAMLLERRDHFQTRAKRDVNRADYATEVRTAPPGICTIALSVDIASPINAEMPDMLSFVRQHGMPKQQAIDQETRCNCLT